VEDNRVTIWNWKSPKLVLDDEDPDAFFADEPADHGLAGCEYVAAVAGCFLN